MGVGLVSHPTRPPLDVADALDGAPSQMRWIGSTASGFLLSPVQKRDRGHPQIGDTGWAPGSTGSGRGRGTSH